MAEAEQTAILGKLTSRLEHCFVLLVLLEGRAAKGTLALFKYSQPSVHL